MPGGTQVRERVTVQAVDGSNGIWRPLNDRLPRGSAEMTIAMVCHLFGTPTVPNGNTFYDGTGANAGFWARAVPEGGTGPNAQFSFTLGTGAGFVIGRSPVVAPSPRIHVVVCTVSVSGGSATVYLNSRPGTPVALAGYGVTVPTAQTYLASRASANPLSAACAMIDFAQFDVVLTAGEVRALTQQTQRDGGLPEVTDRGAWDWFVRGEQFESGQVQARCQKPAGVDLRRTGNPSVFDTVLLNAPPSQGGVLWGS